VSLTINSVTGDVRDRQAAYQLLQQQRLATAQRALGHRVAGRPLDDSSSSSVRIPDERVEQEAILLALGQGKSSLVDRALRRQHEECRQR
jgi:hypothetical protein